MVRLEYLHSLEGGMLNKVDGKNVVDCLKPDFFQKQNEMIRSVFFTTKNRSEQCV